MKIWSEKSSRSSWDIALRMNSGHPALCAVDSGTGETIAVLIDFYDNGGIIIADNAEQALERHGYDPSQHNNIFTDSGALETL